MSKNSKILLSLIGLYAIIFSVISIWKYSNFLYGGLDLAIINNVFFNTAHGSWFWSSIQDHAYPGDHFTPILILLLPIYYLWQSPETLLILQSIFLGLAAWPIYKIAEIKLGSKYSLWIAVLWLVCPLTHNINLFEFHFIAFLPFFLLMAFYFYIQKSYNLLLVFSFLSLLIREDVSFILIVFGILIIFNNLKDNKARQYGIAISLTSIFYLLIAMRVINAFSPSNFSPFAFYYNWLTDTNIFEFISHILSYLNFEMVVGFLLPLMFIPLLRPKWLLLALIPLLQIMLSISGGGALVWQLHYGALFLPAIFIAFIYSFNKANALVYKKIQTNYLLIIALIVVNIYLWIDFGILKDSYEIKKAPDFSGISSEASVLSSFNYLANFSSRDRVYSLHYHFLSVGQFAQAEYKIEETPDYIIIDKTDFEYYDETLKTSAWAGEYYIDGYLRLEELLTSYGAIEVAGETIVFEKDYVSQLEYSLDFEKYK